MTTHKNKAVAAKPKLKRKDYEKELRRLQAELCLLQGSVKHSGQRIIIVFEGRDGAGKGGTIRAITEKVSRVSSESWHFLLRQTVKRLSSTCNAILSTSRLLAKL
jgi:polyphosphate kinase 2 (PPK2 family)